MKRMAVLAVGIVLAISSAAAETATGNSALALASLVAEQSAVLSLDDRSVMGQLIHASPNFTYLPNKKISVEADAVVCRQSNVDLTERSCELTFGAKKVTVMGRKAQALFATIAEIGVAPDGAAGKSFESLSHLACSVDVGEIKQKTGGGVDCKYQPGAD
jgi:hypothetical protein